MEHYFKVLNLIRNIYTIYNKQTGKILLKSYGKIVEKEA